jgi:hypothetical protein
MVGRRYVILGMHEPMERTVDHLFEVDCSRFEGVKHVFIDNHAAVPPKSIKRLLALDEAGCLDILTPGDCYALDRDAASTPMTKESGKTHNFDVFIDARGRSIGGAEDLPFRVFCDVLRKGQV